MEAVELIILFVFGFVLGWFIGDLIDWLNKKVL